MSENTGRIRIRTWSWKSIYSLTLKCLHDFCYFTWLFIFFYFFSLFFCIMYCYFVESRKLFQVINKTNVIRLKSIGNHNVIANRQHIPDILFLFWLIGFLLRQKHSIFICSRLYIYKYLYGTVRRLKSLNKRHFL